MSNLNKIIILILFILISLIATFGETGMEIAESDKGWDLYKDFPEEDIKIYYRTYKNGTILFRGVTHYRSSISSFVVLIRSVEVHPEFVYGTKKASILKEVSDSESYVRVWTKAPWPFIDRDSVVHVFVRQDPKTYAVTISGESASDYVPEDKNCVRIKDIESYWKFIPMKDGNVEIIFHGYGEIGGNVPDWLYQKFCKLILWRMPYETFIGMKKIIERERFQKGTYRIIKEPPFWTNKEKK